MAFTKVVGPGIHTLSNILSHNINSSGIITATKFVGPITGGGGDFNAGILTATSLDINGNGDISGNLVVGGNLTANGDFTTLNTTLREVELLRVDADNDNVAAGIITQRGTGNILDLYDTGSAVFSVRDGGNIIMGAGAGSVDPHAPLHVRTGTTGAITTLLKLHGPFTSNTGSDGTAIDFGTASDTSTGARIIGTREAAGAKGALRFCTGRENDAGFNGGRMVIDETGTVGIGSTIPLTTMALDVIGSIRYSNQSRGAAGSASEPSYAFYSDHDSGMYRGGTNILSFATNGTERLRIDSTGDVRFAGTNLTNNTNKNVNLTAPSYNISEEDVNLIQVENESGMNQISFGGGTSGLNAATTLRFLTASAVNTTTGTEKLRITSGGSILIDTIVTTEASADGNDLIIGSTSDTQKGISIVGSTTNGVGNIFFTDGASYKNQGIIQYRHADDSMRFTTSQYERLRISSGGQVGLGITNPEDYFSSYNRVVMGRTNDTGGMTIRSSSTSGGYISFAKGTSGNQAYRGVIAYQHNGDYFTFSTDVEERLRIVGTGITVTGEVAASQDYPNFRPTLDFNFIAQKKLDPRITYQRTGPASFINEFGKLVLVGANTPRFDHDLDTRECKGLLIEESRTNIAPYANDISQYGGHNITKTANNAVAPDGTTTAAKIEHGGTGTSYLDHINTSINAQNAGSYTYSVWLKAPDDQPDGYYGCQLAVLHSTGGNVEPTVSLNKTWTRYSVTKNFGASDGGNLRVHIIMFRAAPGSTYGGKVIPSYVWAWGAQIEAGAFASSYIPAAGATRGMENVTITGDDFTDFYNPLESTAVCQFDTSNWITYNNNKYERIFAFGNHNTETDTFEVFKQNSSNSEVRYRVRTGNSNVLGAANYTYGTNTTPKVAFAVKLNDAALSIDGGTPGGTSDTGIPMPTVTKLSLGNSGLENNNGVHTFTGYIRRFMYYPVKLPDSQVVTLTS